MSWDREHVGSHVIRHNTIFDCGQNGIVGHLGRALTAGTPPTAPFRLAHPGHHDGSRVQPYN
jgi:hypothetical protein